MCSGCVRVRQKETVEAPVFLSFLGLPQTVSSVSGTLTDEEGNDYCQYDRSLL